MIKTRQEVRDESDRQGLSIASWARLNNFNEFLVYQVLAGTKKGKRGMAHNIAIALKLKDGQPFHPSASQADAN